MDTRTLYFALTLSLSIASAARSQEALLEEQSVRTETELRDDSAKSPFHVGPSIVILEASQDAKTAKGRVALIHRNGLNIDISVKAPIDDSGERTVLTTLDGLANQASVTAQATKLFFRIGDGAKSDAYNSEKADSCNSYRLGLSITELRTKFPAPNFKSPDSIDWTKFVELMKSPNDTSAAGYVLRKLSSEARDAILKASSRWPKADEAKTILDSLDKLLDEKDFYPIEKPNPRQPPLPTSRRKALSDFLEISKGHTPTAKADIRLWNRLFLEALLKDAIRTFPDDGVWTCDSESLPRKLRAAYLAKLPPPVIVFAKAEVGGKTYKYLDLTTLKPAKQSHTNSALGAGIGILFPSNIFLGLRHDHLRESSDAKPRQLCTPVESPVADECFNLPAGPPTVETHDRTILESRVIVFKGLGVAPSAFYDWSDKTYGAVLTLFFLQEKKGLLSGGISAGWKSDDHQFTASAFVGVPFDIKF